MNCWMILEIDPTNDIKIIRHAYAKLTKQYHPEENPEEFKRIQEAYKQAISYAKTPSQKGNSDYHPKERMPYVEKKQYSPVKEVKKESPLHIIENDDFDGEVVDIDPELEDAYYDDLFKISEHEKQEKIEEQGRIYIYKIKQLVNNPKIGTAFMWRDILKREAFALAVYDIEFIKNVYWLFEEEMVLTDSLFEFYYYFLKYKKKEDWLEFDFKLNQLLIKKLS